MALSHIWHDFLLFFPMVKIITEFLSNSHSNVLWTELEKFYKDLYSGIPNGVSRDANYGPEAICQKVTYCDVSVCHQDTAVVKTNITVIPNTFSKPLLLL